jgi:hypothetical protein
MALRAIAWRQGGGIAVEAGSPTIKGNIIQNNTGSNAGGGIGVGFASPLIQGNIIRNNTQAADVTGGVGVFPQSSIRAQQRSYPRWVHGCLLVGGAILVWALRP